MAKANRQKDVENPGAEGETIEVPTVTVGTADVVIPPDVPNVNPLEDTLASTKHENEELRKTVLQQENTIEDLNYTIEQLTAVRDEHLKQLKISQELLQESYSVINGVVRKKIYSQNYNDSYELAADIHKFLIKK